ncbi:MAG: hypothetical protein PHV43_02715, partial [Candidatus Colwellbacteria bacterium]|nr:hypothetical protein [Candidatus Colwellbacteria bacterium]
MKLQTRMKISPRTIIVILLVIIFCALVVVFVFAGLANRKQEIPIRSLIQAVVQENALSEKGAITKRNLIAGFNGEAGTLLATEDMGIGYLPPPDESVMVFITGVDV